MSTRNLCPVQTLLEIFKQLPDFGMGKWLWEKPFRVDPEKSQLAEYDPAGWKDLRNTAKKYFKRNVIVIISPFLVILLFFVLEFIWFIKTDKIPIFLSTGLNALNLGALLTYNIWLIQYADTKLKFIDDNIIYSILKKGLSNSAIENLDYFTKAKKYSNFIKLLSFLLWFVMIFFSINL
jgi:hypothetical protein